MKPPRVSVVLPVYNGQEKLERQLTSILAQTFTDFSLTIIDNASEDDSAAIAHRLAESDGRVRFFQNPRNMGFMHSYLRGTDLSLENEFFIYASHNDYWSPDYLARCVAALEANPGSPLAYSWCQFVDREGRPVSLFGPDKEAAPYRDGFDLHGLNPMDRFLTIITSLGMCTAFYGLIRMSSYLNQRWAALTPCIAIDNFFLAVLAQREGPFEQIPAALFSRETPYDRQGATYADRAAALLRMNASGSCPDPDAHYGYLKFLLAHVQASLGGYEMVGPLADFKTRVEYSHRTVKAMMGRYGDPLEDELTRGAQMICEGRVHSSPVSGEKWSVEGESSKLTDTLMYAKHYEYLLRARTFYPKLPKLNLACAICLIQIGRPREALLAVEEELALNPICRQSLDLKAGLSKTGAAPPADGAGAKP